MLVQGMVDANIMENVTVEQVTMDLIALTVSGMVFLAMNSFLSN